MRSYVGRGLVSDCAVIGYTMKRACIFALWQRPICEWSAMRRWLIGTLSPTSWRSVTKWFLSMRRSFGDGFTNVTDLSAHDSVVSQQVQDEVRSTVKNGTQMFVEKRPWYPRSQPVLPLPSPCQLSVHHHGNNCSILIYSLQAQQLHLSSFKIWKLANKWFDYEMRPF